MEYSVYVEVTGEILKSGECPGDVYEAQADESQGEKVWPERLDDTLWRIVDGVKVAREPDLVEVERVVLSGIDRAAENVRSLFITNTESQAGVYLVKEAEAREFLAAPSETGAELTPNLTREAARTGSTRTAVATLIVAKAAHWREISAVIEDMRLGAKDAVRAATTEAGKRSAGNIDWSPVTDLA